MSLAIAPRLAKAMSKQIFSVTQPAATRLHQLLHHHHQNNVSKQNLKNELPIASDRQNCSTPLDSKDSIAVKISLQRKGCSGFSYQLSFVDLNHVAQFDEVIKTENGLNVVIDSKAVMFLAGTQMDFMEDPLRSRFIFNNPNQKSSCGCGKSFSV